MEKPLSNCWSLFLELQTECNYKRKYSFFTVEIQSNPILGYQTCIEMGLVKVPASISALFTKKSSQKTQIQEKFADVFLRIGKLPGEVAIHVKENSIPSVNHVYRTLFALHERVKSEIDCLECLDIIEKLTTQLSGLI